MLLPSFAGTVVTHVPPVNVVVAVVADGENVICTSGTLMVDGVPLAERWIVEPLTLTVNGQDPGPLAFSTLLNQMWQGARCPAGGAQASPACPFDTCCHA